MTTEPPADPSPRALGESLAALAAQVADLRSQIRALNTRLDQAGLHAGLNLAARFEELAGTVADALDTASPADPPRRTGSAWTATSTTLSWPACAGGPTPCSASNTPATQRRPRRVAHAAPQSARIAVFSSSGVLAVMAIPPQSRHARASLARTSVVGTGDADGLDQF
jgi:hypothetical protein